MGVDDAGQPGLQRSHHYPQWAEGSAERGGGDFSFPAASPMSRGAGRSASRRWPRWATRPTHRRRRPTGRMGRGTPTSPQAIRMGRIACRATRGARSSSGRPVLASNSVMPPRPAPRTRVHSRHPVPHSGTLRRRALPRAMAALHSLWQWRQLSEMCRAPVAICVTADWGVGSDGTTACIRAGQDAPRRQLPIAFAERAQS